MSDNWENYYPAPIETFHSEAMGEFHKVADENHKIGGIEFNKLIANFKTKICKFYNISTSPIKKGQG